MQPVSLEEILSYKNPDIPARFVKIYGVSESEAQIIFDDVIRWLWIGHRSGFEKESKPFVVDQSIVVLDEMWHNFVLFTREYMEFCQKYFGRYLHHAPFKNSDSEKIKTQLKGMSGQQKGQHLMDEKRWQYEYIYDHLGEDTFIRWYKEYPKRYSALNLATKIYETEQARHDKKNELIEKYRSATTQPTL